MLKTTSSLPAKVTVVFQTRDLPALVYVTSTPCEQGARLPAKILIPTELWKGQRPVFKWYNSKDYDGSIAFYQIQLAPDGDWDDIGSFVETNIAVDAGPYTTYRIQTSLTKYQVYSWRVRAWDGYVWSDWSEPSGVVWTDKVLTDFPAKITVSSSLQWLKAKITVLVDAQELKAQATVVRAGTDDLLAKVTVMQVGTSDLKASINPGYYLFFNLYATVTVLPYNDIWATIWIPRNVDLPAKLTVQHSVQLQAQVTVQQGSNLNAKMTVTRYEVADLDAQCFVSHCRNLSARIWISPKYVLPAKITVTLGDQHLPAKLTVVKLLTSNLPAKINLVGKLLAKITVIREDTKDLFAKVTVIQDGTSDLDATLTVKPYNNLPAQIFLKVHVTTGLPATITTIPWRPNNVVLYADVDEATWQDQDVITFWWDDARDLFFNCIYYIAWNDTPDYVVTGSDENANDVLTIQKTANFTGHWYFHIRAMNDNGFYSPTTTHFHVQFNHVPSVPTGPFLVNGFASGVTIQGRDPMFRWTQSTDDDQLDVLHYHLQVSTSPTFDSQVVNQTNVSAGSYSYVQYSLTVGERLPAADTYYWRVRASDAWQYGSWSGTYNFILESTSTDLFASINIPIRGVTNLKASIYVIDYSDLPATVNVYIIEHSDLKAAVRVRKYQDEDLPATLFVWPYVELKAQIYIIDYVDLYATLTVVGLPGSSDLPATINVCQKVTTDLLAKITVKWGDSDDLSAQVFIVANRDLPADITVYTPEHYGWIDDFNDDLPATITVSRAHYKLLQAEITTIRSRPGDVTIFSNVAESTWQGEQDIRFFWNSVTYDFFPVYGYRVRLDHTSNSIVDASDQMLLDREKLYDLEIYEGAGSYWFHVAAVDTQGSQGNTAHYNVMYNNLPSAPGEPMLVNEEDSFGGTPIAASQASLDFEWGAATDVDDLDSLTYDLQISTETDFSLTTELIEDIGIYRYTFTGSIDPALYYWRVRAFDGHQYGEWSQTAQFRVNNPPEPPTDLMVMRV